VCTGGGRHRDVVGVHRVEAGAGVEDALQSTIPYVVADRPDGVQRSLDVEGCARQQARLLQHGGVGTPEVDAADHSRQSTEIDGADTARLRCGRG
jgi:hypothetical protein